MHAVVDVDVVVVVDGEESGFGSRITRRNCSFVYVHVNDYVHVFCGFSRNSDFQPGSNLSALADSSDYEVSR